jgi:PPM family protein phosphatase
MIVSSSGLTDIGRVRGNNEDFFLLDDGKGLYVLADGMGGHNAGEVAASGACRLFDAYFDPAAPDMAAHMTSVFARTNALLFEQGSTHEELRGMGATFIACHVAGSAAYLLHAGDVRGYLYRDGGLRQLTRDHSLVAELVRSGHLSPAEAAAHPLRNQVTQAVGNREEAAPDVDAVGLRPGDLLLLCSDGLWGAVDDETIRAGLAGESDSRGKASRLVARANEAGGKDNVTVVVLRCEEGGSG